MKKVIRLLVSMTAVVVFAAPQVLAQQAQKSEPWQSSWDTFVELHNKCLQTETCNAKQFVGKEVVWIGRVKVVDAGGIALDMGGPSVQDKTGKEGAVVSMRIKPEPEQASKWKDVAVGSRVRFRTRTDGGMTGLVISFVSIGGGMALINSSGAELLEVLASQ